MNKPKKNRLGFYLIPLLIAANILVWLLFPPVFDGRENFARTYAGEVLGSTAIILMAYSLFLTTRPKWAEKFFGGLDKMYRAHRRSSTTAFIILFIHLFIVPISYPGFQLGNYLAVIAFTGVVGIVLITLSPEGLAAESYEGWKKLHRFIGIFFIIGFIHALTVDSLDALIAITWVQLFFIVGVVSYLYTEIFGRFLGKYLPYRVENIQALNNEITEVDLLPNSAELKKHQAGQFLFVRFPNSKGLNESHPFTISSAPSENRLRLTIKSSGDFTERLKQTLEVGAEAIIEGPFGLFDYKTGGGKQIWVAGGIGITPFLAFIRDMENEPVREIYFYYSVRVPAEMVFQEELENADAKYQNLTMFYHYSEEMGHLTFEDVVSKIPSEITEYDLYLCGPLPMIESFSGAATQAGIPTDQIHYEEFSLR